MEFFFKNFAMVLGLMACLFFLWKIAEIVLQLP